MRPPVLLRSQFAAGTHGASGTSRVCGGPGYKLLLRTSRAGRCLCGVLQASESADHLLLHPGTVTVQVAANTEPVRWCAELQSALRWRKGVLSFEGVTDLLSTQWFAQLPFLILVSCGGGLIGALFNYMRKKAMQAGPEALKLQLPVQHGCCLASLYRAWLLDWCVLWILCCMFGRA